LFFSFKNILRTGSAMTGFAPSTIDGGMEAFLRSIVPPEEERRQYTSAPATGFRWFASPNIVDLVRARLDRARARPAPPDPGKAA
jgi:hypothetical protein